ncbi:hypothetical protein DFJ74DRAFT_200722 [Hyaloraphidium curvatum]|nr:hypothetical protein DFJ74DRAFT_200722 [Hyaloraphidium curvatum]
MFVATQCQPRSKPPQSVVWAAESTANTELPSRAATAIRRAMEKKQSEKATAPAAAAPPAPSRFTRAGRWLAYAFVPLLAALLYPHGSSMLGGVENVRVKRAPLIPVSEFGNIISYTGAPETEVILYYFGTNATWEQLATSPFTLIYLCFGVIEEANLNLLTWPEWCDNGNPLNPDKDCELGVSILKKYGKKVGISIGGGDGQRKVPRVFTKGYEEWKRRGRGHDIIENWVKGMLAFVKDHGMDALDFDNEEAHTSWTGGTKHDTTEVEALSSRGVSVSDDQENAARRASILPSACTVDAVSDACISAPLQGLDFMGELQVELRKQAGIEFIFTVSLQPPFYCPVIPIEDPGARTGDPNNLTFPVEPRAPWYNNYMYLFEAHPESYNALTYLIFMCVRCLRAHAMVLMLAVNSRYYPFENMWEWVSSIESISRNFSIMEGQTKYANLSAIYRSQINYDMKAGTVGRLEAKKMIIATQTNEPTADKAWIPRDMLRDQLRTLNGRDRPAGVAVWSHPHSMSEASCGFLAAACEFSKQCATAEQLICPPKQGLAQVNPTPGTNGNAGNVNLTQAYDWGLSPRAASSSSTARSTATRTSSAGAVPTSAPSGTDNTSAAEPAHGASRAVMAMLMFVLGCLFLL